MGYTTKFEGEFRCRRTIAPQIAAFLEGIAEDPREIAVLADWLEDQSDDRTDQVRACRSHREASNVFHALKPEQTAYLLQFSNTRRMRRDEEIARSLADPVRERVGLPVGPEGCYFVGGLRDWGQDRDSSVLEYNTPPAGQPGLWCQWDPTEDGSAIHWNGAEKFYYYIEWLEYLIKHFLTPWGVRLDGEARWRGEDPTDRGVILVRDSVVTATPKE